MEKILAAIFTNDWRSGKAIELIAWALTTLTPPGKPRRDICDWMQTYADSVRSWNLK